MGIRAKLQLSVLVGGMIAVLVLALVLVSTSRQVKEALEQSSAIDGIVKGVFELSIVTNDYLLHHEDRARAQWEVRYDSLGRILSEIQAHDSEEQVILDEVVQDHASLQPLFVSLVANHEGSNTNEDAPAVSLEVERRLVSQLLVAAQTMVSGAFRLAEAVGARVESTQRRGSLLAMTLGLPILTSIVVFIVLVSNRVVARVMRLQQGTEIIASGET